jgi:transposase
MTIRWRSRAELVHHIVTLARDGLSRRAITRALGISRNTVKSVLAAHTTQRDTEHSAVEAPKGRAPRSKKVDGFEDRIGELMQRYPDIRAQRVFEILRDEGFTGGYTAIKRYVRKVRPSPKPAPSLATPSYGPGEMAESDWSPYTITFTSGVKLTVQAFNYVLVYSPRKYFAIFESNDLYALMDGHEGAFDRWGGAAHRCTYDSQKPVVLRWEGNQPIYNPRFLAFAAHYEFRPRAVRGDPNAKATAERSFREFNESFLNGRSFRDIDDMRFQLVHWLDRVVDQRPRRRDGKTSLERFAEEKTKLVRLPQHPYDTARVAYRLCSLDGFIDWGGNRYAIAFEHVTDILPIRVTQRELFVYAADLRCIARHELAPRGAGMKVDPTGLHPRPSHKSASDLDQLAMTFQAMGDGAAKFFRLLAAGPPRIWGHQARCILLLRARYRTSDLDAALAHAARFGALEFAAVERILEARCIPRSLDEYVAEETARRLEETLGERRTEPRDLTEYDRLPLSGKSHQAPAPGPSHEERSCPSAPHEPPKPQPSLTTISSSKGSAGTSGSSA